MSDIDEKCNMLAEHITLLEKKIDKLQKSLETLEGLLHTKVYKYPELEPYTPYTPVRDAWPTKPFPYDYPIWLTGSTKD